MEEQFKLLREEINKLGKVLYKDLLSIGIKCYLLLSVYTSGIVIWYWMFR